MKAAIYARVSKSEQDPDNQVKALTKLADSLGMTIVDSYVDTVSGADSNRPMFRSMLEDSSKGKFQVLLIWALDRFSREGISITLSYIERLSRNGVSIKSLQESWLDTRDTGLGQLLISIFSWVAAQERKRISERTKEGLKKAKNVGKRGKDKKPRKKGGYFLRHSPHLKRT